MKAAQIRQLRDDELSGKLEDLQRKLFELRTQSATEKIENDKLVKNTKKDIARIKTIIREKQLEAK